MPENEFIIGIRPGHFQEKHSANSKSIELPAIIATVNVIETLGKETFLDLSTGAHTLTALLDGESELKPHENIELLPNMEKIHLFSKDSGEALFLNLP
jgi:multiple sugar transport system ATP-binding protein